MKLTRGGVAYDLYNSPYEVIIKYNNFDLIYKFSSAKNVDKFENKRNEQRLKIHDSLSKRFKINLFLDFVADLQLYSLIESRGFLLISSEDSVFECLEEVTFDGINLTKKNLQD